MSSISGSQSATKPVLTTQTPTQPPVQKSGSSTTFSQPPVHTQKPGSSTPTQPPAQKPGSTTSTQPPAVKPGSTTPGTQPLVSSPSAFPGNNVVFIVARVNKHSVFNKWLTIDETANFLFQQKEKKAYTSQQCRIVVKGAKHFPLQISAGPSTEFLYPTWAYVKTLEGAIPLDLEGGYKGVESWVENHVREVAGNNRKGGGGSDTGASCVFQREEDDEELLQALNDAADDDDEEEEEGEFVDSAPSSFASSRMSPEPRGGNKTGGGISSFFSGFYLAAGRPQTKDEWNNRVQRIEHAKRNRTIVIMVFFGFYTFLMRILSFDGYLLLLVLLEIFLFYLATNYRSLILTLAKRGAKTRFNRFKDWFTFGVARKNAVKKTE